MRAAILRPWSAVGAAALVAVSALTVSAPASAQITRALGLDISAWQGNISQTTWNNIRNVENRQFVILRSSRGGTTGYYNQSNADNDPPTNTLSQRYDDPYYVQNMNRATTAGMYAGSYHFSRPDIIASTLNANGIANTGIDEADHFIQMAGPWMRPGYLLPMHDLEAGDGIRSDQDMAIFTENFSQRIFDVMGIRPGIYTNGNYAEYVLGGATSAMRSEIVTENPVLWSARWPNQENPNAIDVQNGHPKDSISYIYGPWDDYGVTHPWHFWQYTSRGRLQSFSNGGSNLDMNVAQGGVEYLRDHLVPAVWMNNSNGDWSTLANWNSGQTPIAPVTGPGQVAPVGTQTLPTPRLPGAAGSGVTSGQYDTVILDRPAASITVTLSTGTHNIRKLFMRETLNITGGSLGINYVPSADSTPMSAQFSGPVNMSGGSLSVHTLQVDATRIFTFSGGTLALNKINLMPHASSPAKILVAGNVTLNPLADAAAVIANGTGAGTSGRVDLGGGVRAFDVGNGFADADVTISTPVINGGLVKQGLGTLVLSGANTYAGDTAVEAGRLRLPGKLLGNGADVHLTTGALLDLTFTDSPDVIDSLFIDGVSMAAGTWGAEGSLAQFTSPLITGTGFLQVSTFVAPPSPADFNGDGFVNSIDMGIWEGGFETAGSATPQQGDADGDLDVDGADFLTWQQQLNLPAAAPAGAGVPEPTGLALAAWGLAAVVRRRARK